MTLSRHAQVENLTSLLGVRRGELRQRTLRQAAYLNFIGAILDRPAAQIELASPLASLAPRPTPLLDRSQAA